VRNGVNPTRLYLEQVTTDDIQRQVIVEIDIPRPAQPVAANPAYSLWSLNFTDSVDVFYIGAEIDGVKYSTNQLRITFEFAVCPGISRGE
jgi:hypothetical protein